MADAIQQLSKKIRELNQSNVSEQAVPDKDWSQPQKASPDMIVCYGCGEIGHKIFECSRQRRKRVSQRQESEAVDSERLQGNPNNMNRRDTFTKQVNTTGTQAASSLYANIKIDGEFRQCLIDSGSEVSIIPETLA